MAQRITVNYATARRTEPNGELETLRNLSLRDARFIGFFGSLPLVSPGVGLVSVPYFARGERGGQVFTPYESGFTMPANRFCELLFWFPQT